MLCDLSELLPDLTRLTFIVAAAMVAVAIVTVAEMTVS
jgi:hypothetical protein